jgi:hypothetical protein
LPLELTEAKREFTHFSCVDHAVLSLLHLFQQRIASAFHGASPARQCRVNRTATIKALRDDMAHRYMLR